MKKLLLIAGCSHAAGSEIDGTQDSKYNRSNSFGSKLAVKLGREPINIAEPGSTNPSIARSVLDWVTNEYSAATMDVRVLIAWTESSRMEVPSHRVSWYDQHNPHGDWCSTAGRKYWRINMGWPGFDPEEKEVIPPYQKFMANNEVYLEILSANLALQMQYFLRSEDIDFTMCNTMHMFSASEQLAFYTNLLDTTKYMNIYNDDDAFYWKYKNAGYANPKAKYWHHDEIPHELYSEALYQFIRKGGAE